MFAMILSLPLPSSANEKIILTTHNLCPYGCYPEHTADDNYTQDNFTGIAVDVVKCALNTMDISLELIVLPWPRAQMYVKENIADGFFAASQNKERDQYATMSAIIAAQQWRWYVLKESHLIPTSDQFQQEAQIGAFIGSNMLKWLEENNYHVIARTLNSERLIQMLLKKRVDAILINNYVADELIAKHGLQNKLVSYLNKNKPLGVYFSNKFLANHKDFLASFNQSLAQCKLLDD